jgi:hypothetical protein
MEGVRPRTRDSTKRDNSSDGQDDEDEDEDDVDEDDVDDDVEDEDDEDVPIPVCESSVLSLRSFLCRRLVGPASQPGKLRPKRKLPNPGRPKSS